MSNHDNAGVKAMVVLRRIVANLYLRNNPKTKRLQWALRDGSDELVSEADALLHKIGARTYPCTFARDGLTCQCRQCRAKATAKGKGKAKKCIYCGNPLKPQAGIAVSLMCDNCQGGRK